MKAISSAPPRRSRRNKSISCCGTVGRAVRLALHETAERLALSPIVDSERNSSPNRTAFLTPIDHVNAGSGVSPENRALTISAMARSTSVANEFVRRDTFIRCWRRMAASSDVPAIPKRP